MNPQKRFDAVIALGLVFFLLLLTLKAVPMQYPTHFNFDESMELTRVHLLNRQYIFYDEVWNDHPLGLTRVFQFFENFFPLTLPSARYIVLLFSSLNLLIFYSLLRLNCDRIAATIATLVLITTYIYVSLSGYALKEIPTLTLIVASILGMVLYARSEGKKKFTYLLLSSFFFICSLNIKLAGITAIPTLISIGISGKSKIEYKIKDAVIWLAFGGAIFALLAVTILPFSYESVIGSHSSASGRFAAENAEETLGALLYDALQQDTLYVGVTLLAIALVPKFRNKNQFLPPLLLLGFNLLRFQTTLPVWSNYYLHLVLPGAWLIGLLLTRCNLQAVWKNCKQGKFTEAKIVLPLLLILGLGSQGLFNTYKIATASQPRRYRHKALVARNWNAQNYKPHPAEEFFKQYQGSRKVLLTDNPYFIHKFKLDTPPETAIFSRKRLVTEQLDGEFILEVVRKRKPDFVLLERFVEEFMESEALSEFLQENYTEYSLKPHSSRLFIARYSDKGR